MKNAVSRPPATPSAWAARAVRARRQRDSVLHEVGAGLQRAIELLREAWCGEAWLVGSFARGRPGPESDVDLLVRGLSPERRSEVLDALEHLFRRPVDLAELERVPPERLELALDHGRRLFP